MSLAARLAARIAREGPIPLVDYIDLCLHDPEDGYYATRPGLGADGDFITAPHVSQMFGELLGLWAAEVWRALGQPPHVRLVELGPGDGTMIADALRAGRAAPGFLEAADLWLVEVSAPLRRRQAQALAGRPATWAASLAEIPEGQPVIVLANEFLDCLPITQWQRVGAGWRERRVGLDASGQLAFVLLPCEAGEVAAKPGVPLPRFSGEEGSALASRCPGLGPPGPVAEDSPALRALGAQVGGLLARSGGAALFIDYGRDETGFGDTLQAVRRHRREHPLAAPGEADLTAHVDFPAFVAAAREAGAEATRIVSQRAFLLDLGIETRAAALARARPDQAPVIARQLDRLVGPDQMGELFKVVSVHAPGLAVPGP